MAASGNLPYSAGLTPPKLSCMDQIKPPPRSRSIYLLPYLFTTGGLFAGFYAIIAASNGDFVNAAVAVFVAAVMDGLDGGWRA